MKQCEVCEALKRQENVIFDSSLWRIGLDSSDQYYLGRSYITLRRHCGDLAELTTEEWNELLVVIRKFEKAIRQEFGATLFNFGCLMNNAYQSKPYNPHIHWHVRPRYDHSVTVIDETFEDNEFGHHYARGTNRQISAAALNDVLQRLKSAMI